MKVLNRGGITEILIYEDIGKGMFGDGVTDKKIHGALKEAPKTDSILVRLNSPGGDVFQGMSIYNVLASSGREIVTQIDGAAFSAASVIFMAGDRRVMADNAFGMIHEAWGVAVGRASDLRGRADAIEEITDQFGRLYAKRMGRDREEIDAWMEAETYFGIAPEVDSIQDAIESGFATEVAESMAIAAKFDPERYNIKHVPEPLKKMQAKASEKVAAKLAAMQQRVAKVSRDRKRA